MSTSARSSPNCRLRPPRGLEARAARPPVLNACKPAAPGIGMQAQDLGDLCRSGTTAGGQQDGARPLVPGGLPRTCPAFQFGALGRCR